MIRSVETDVAVIDSGKAAIRSRQVAVGTSTPLLATKAVAAGEVRGVAKGTVDL